MTEQSAGHEEELPRTAYLDHTLRRAQTAAEQRSHRYVTLEHLLLALLDDPDAARLLQTTGADIAVIRSTVSDAVNNRMASLVVPDARTPSFSYRFDTLFVSAAADANRLGRREIDGALVLIAIAKDAECNASGILAANGFSAMPALEVLKTPPQPQRAPQTVSSPQKPRQAKAVSAQEAPVRDQNPPKADAPRPPMAAQIASLANGGETMEDMIASVRTILEAEEFKEREQTQKPSPVSRPEPQLKANGGAFKPAERPVRLEPRIGPQPKRLSDVAAPGGSGFAEPPAPAFDLEKTPKPEKRAAPAKPAPRGKAGNLALLAKVLENIRARRASALPRRSKFRSAGKKRGLSSAGLPGGERNRRPQGRRAVGPSP